MKSFYTYLNPHTNSDWAKDVRARLADLNELLNEAIERDVIIHGEVTQSDPYTVNTDGMMQRRPTITITLSERI